MALREDLIAKARQKLLAAQAIPNFRTVARRELLDLVGMRPSGLGYVQWMGIDFKEFALEIDKHRPQLRPWLTVYAAATGLMGPWMTIRTAWVLAAPPPSGGIHPTVDEWLDSLFSGYVTTITN